MVAESEKALILELAQQVAEQEDLGTSLDLLQQLNDLLEECFPHAEHSRVM